MAIFVTVTPRLNGLTLVFRCHPWLRSFGVHSLTPARRLRNPVASSNSSFLALVVRNALSQSLIKKLF